VYLEITQEQFEEADAWADGILRELNITYEKSYKRRTFDCENFSRLKAALITLYLSRTIENSEGFGIPVGTLGFKRKGTEAHEIVHAKIKGKTDYYLSEPYPDHPHKWYITGAEKKTIDFDVM